MPSFLSQYTQCRNLFLNRCMCVFMFGLVEWGPLALPKCMFVARKFAYLKNSCTSENLMRSHLSWHASCCSQVEIDWLGSMFYEIEWLEEICAPWRLTWTFKANSVCLLCFENCCVSAAFSCHNWQPASKVFVLSGSSSHSGEPCDLLCWWFQSSLVFAENFHVGFFLPF